MNNICEIEVNPESVYSSREPYVNGRMDVRTAPYYDWLSLDV